MMGYRQSEQSRSLSLESVCATSLVCTQSGGHQPLVESLYHATRVLSANQTKYPTYLFVIKNKKQSTYGSTAYISGYKRLLARRRAVPIQIPQWLQLGCLSPLGYNLYYLYPCSDSCLVVAVWQLRSGSCGLVVAVWQLRSGSCSLVVAVWQLRSGSCGLVVAVWYFWFIDMLYKPFLDLNPSPMLTCLLSSRLVFILWSMYHAVDCAKEIIAVKTCTRTDKSLGGDSNPMSVTKYLEYEESFWQGDFQGNQPHTEPTS